MKPAQLPLIILIFAAIAVVPIDIMYASRFVPRFKEIEKQRIVTSNQLATAKIVSENLDHVRDLVFRNMDFAGQKDSVSQESVLFEFFTECVNDLKMRLISVHPLRPTHLDRVTTYSYEIELEGDFFSLGELCAKLENSQRVMAITSFQVFQTTAETKSGDPKAKPAPTSSKRTATIKIHLDTFRVRG